MINTLTRLCKEDYCSANGLNPRDLIFKFIKNNPRKEAVFEVIKNGNRPFNYTCVKRDLSFLTDYKTLSILKQDMLVNEGVNKTALVGWIFSKTGIVLLPEDIDFVYLEKNHLSVVISLNSMRFKNSFHITFI